MNVPQKSPILSLVCVEPSATPFIASGLKSHLAEGMTLASVSADLPERAISAILQSSAAFLQWDGTNAPTHVLLRTMAARWDLRHVPLYVGVSQATPALKNLIEEVGAVAVFDLPLDDATAGRLLRSLSGTIKRTATRASTEKLFFDAIRQEDIPQARSLLDSLMLLDPRNRRYLLLLGRLFETKNNLDDAVALYRRLLDTDAKYVKAWAALSQTLTRLGRFAEAKDAGENAESLSAEYLEEILMTGAKPSGDEAPALMAQTSGSQFASKFFEQRIEAIAQAGSAADTTSYVQQLEKQITSKEILGNVSLKATAIVSGATGRVITIPSKSESPSKSQGIILIADDLNGSLPSAIEVPVDTPAPVSLVHLTKLFATKIEALGKADSAKEGLDPPCLGRSLVIFHEDPAGGKGQLRFLNDAGFVDVELFSEWLPAYNRIRSRPPAGIVIWYQTSHMEGIHLVRAIQEDRELPPMATMFFCPGQDSLRNFAMAAQELIIDRAAINLMSRTALTAAIKDLFVAFDAGEGLQGVWTELRLGKTKDGRIAPESASRFQQQSETLIRAPGKSYWGASQRVLRQIAKGDAQQAIAMSNLMVGDFPNRHDARLVLANAKAAAGVAPDEAGHELFKHVISMPGFSEDRAFRVGRFLASHNAGRALSLLIQHWAQNPLFEKGANLDYLCAHAHLLAGRMDAARCFATSALKADLHREEFLVTAGDLCLASDEPQASSRYWTLADQLCGHRSCEIRLKLAASFKRAGDKESAQGIIEDIGIRWPSTNVLKRRLAILESM